MNKFYWSSITFGLIAIGFAIMKEGLGFYFFTLGTLLSSFAGFITSK
jgi:hypothetical protein